MNIFITVLIEFLIISSSVLILFRFRSKLGLAPLYIFLGALQYLQVFTSANVSFEIFGGYTIYPISVIIFSAVLFAVLLIYIKDGVASSRTLILGIIISNFLLTAIAGIAYFQQSVLGMISENSIKSLFLIDYKYFIVGTIILLLDFILLVILYQFLIKEKSKLYYFLILFISLASVLVFDSLVFNLILRIGNPGFAASLVSHIIGKTLAAFGFSLVLYIYLKYIDKESGNIGFIANQNRDIFSILSYREKYFNLKVEKVQTEKKLVSQLEATLNNISDGFVSLDPNWCYIYVNIKASEFLGRSSESLIGKHIWTEFPDGVGLPFYNAYYKAVETQQTQYFQEYHESLGRWFDNRIYPSPEGLAIYFTDITEKKKAELALKESENHIRTILETEPECIKQLSAKGELIYMNSAGLAMIEADNLELIIGTSVLNLISPNHQRAFKKLTRDVFKGKSGKLVFEIIGIKGTKRWLETHAVPLKDTNGDIISLLGVTRDITERKKAEELLIKNEEYLDNIINNIGDPIFVKDEQSQFLLVNDACCKMFNLSRENIIGKTLAEDIPPAEMEGFLKIDKQVLSTGLVNINEESLTVRGGKTRIISTKKTRYVDDNNNKYLIGIIRDLTERKKNEIALKTSEAKFRAMVDASPIGIFFVQNDGNVTYGNEADMRMTGLTLEETLGLNWINAIHPEDRERTTKKWVNAMDKGIPYKDQGRYLHKDGKIVFWDVLTAPVIIDEEVTGFIGMVVDITEKIKDEEEITKYKNHLEELVELRTNQLEKEKIKAQSADLMKSAFLATMSHELRTPMNSIIGFTGILLKEYAGPMNEEQKKQLSMVKNSGQHLLGLINDILDISKIEAGKLKVSKYPFSYLTTVENTIEFLAPQADKKGLQIITEFSEKNIILNSDERRVEQVLLNLVSNAIKFSNQGTILVKVAIDKNFLTTQIIDQGIGISKDDLNKLFMPFIQVNGGLTRRHEGTGLGLAICKNLIEKLGGTIRVKSNEGEGSNFTFKLPIEQAHIK